MQDRGASACLKIVSTALKMKPKHWIYAVRKGASGGTTLFCSLAFARTMQAQEQVLAPPPVYSVTPPAMQEYEASQPGAPMVEPLAYERRNRRQAGCSGGR